MRPLPHHQTHVKTVLYIQHPAMTHETDTKDSELDVEHSRIENLDNPGASGYALQPHAGPKIARVGIERRLVLKQDFLILPLLALVYFVAYLVPPCSRQYSEGLLTMLLTLGPQQFWKWPPARAPKGARLLEPGLFQCCRVFL